MGGLKGYLSLWAEDNSKCWGEFCMLLHAKVTGLLSGERFSCLLCRFSFWSPVVDIHVLWEVVRNMVPRPGLVVDNVLSPLSLFLLLGWTTLWNEIWICLALYMHDMSVMYSPHSANPESSFSMRCEERKQPRWHTCKVIGCTYKYNHVHVLIFFMSLIPGGNGPGFNLTRSNVHWSRLYQGSYHIIIIIVGQWRHKNLRLWRHRMWVTSRSIGESRWGIGDSSQKDRRSRES